MIEAWVEAIRDELRSQLTLDPEVVGIRPQGQPPATMGHYYIGVDEVQVSSSEQDRTFLKETYTVGVWITMRSGLIPNDNFDEYYLNHAYGISDWERKIKNALHGNHGVRNRANAILIARGVRGSGEFNFAMHYAGRAPTGFKTNWVDGDSSETPTIVRALMFTGGTRITRLHETE